MLFFFFGRFVFFFNGKEETLSRIRPVWSNERRKNIEIEKKGRKPLSVGMKTVTPNGQLAHRGSDYYVYVMMITAKPAIPTWLFQTGQIMNAGETVMSLSWFSPDRRSFHNFSFPTVRLSSFFFPILYFSFLFNLFFSSWSRHKSLKLPSFLICPDRFNALLYIVKDRMKVTAACVCMAHR